MTRDWLDHPEPYNGPETFRAHWQRRWWKIIFQNPDGSFSWSDLNKNKWYYLTQDNRRARPCHPQGPFYLLKADGSALEYQVEASSHYHHVCEWGMDFHCWADLEPFMEGSVLPAGTELTAATTGRLVAPEVVKPVLASAQEIRLTEAELEEADRPAYEEPENTFTVSCLDPSRPDCMVWKPTSEGCRWEKTGAHHGGGGCLAIENHYSDVGMWEQSSLGPQQWSNPFLANQRYRLSAWVRIERSDIDSSEGGPQIGAEFVQSQGPAYVSDHIVEPAAWSQPPVGVDTPVAPGLDWTYLEVITPPCPSFAIYARLYLRFRGRGTAYFSNVRWERVDSDEGGYDPQPKQRR